MSHRTRTRTRIRRARGLSLAELVVVMFLIGAFGVLILGAMTTTGRSTSTTYNQLQTQQTTRQLLDQFTRWADAARPAGGCLVNGTIDTANYPASTCPNVIESGPAVTVTNPDRMVFYAYTNGSVGSSASAITASPDKVEITATSDGRLLLNVYAALTSSTYTTPAWSSTPTSSRLIGVLPPGQTSVLTYTDSCGDPINASGTAPSPGAGCVASSPVALVQLSATFQISNAAPQPVTVTVHLPASTYSQDQP